MKKIIERLNRRRVTNFRSMKGPGDLGSPDYGDYPDWGDFDSWSEEMYAEEVDRVLKKEVRKSGLKEFEEETLELYFEYLGKMVFGDRSWISYGKEILDNASPKEVRSIRRVRQELGIPDDVKLGHRNESVGPSGGSPLAG